MWVYKLLVNKFGADRKTKNQSSLVCINFIIMHLSINSIPIESSTSHHIFRWHAMWLISQWMVAVVVVFFFVVAVLFFSYCYCCIYRWWCSISFRSQVKMLILFNFQNIVHIKYTVFILHCTHTQTHTHTVWQREWKRMASYDEMAWQPIAARTLNKIQIYNGKHKQ